MPFTPSHAAAVLPLARTGLPLTALVVGSIAPDLPYYLPLPVTATTTHGPAGLWADVLFGAAVLAVYVFVLTTWCAIEVGACWPGDLASG